MTFSSFYQHIHEQKFAKIIDIVYKIIYNLQKKKGFYVTIKKIDNKPKERRSRL